MFIFKSNTCLLHNYTYTTNTHIYLCIHMSTTYTFYACYFSTIKHGPHNYIIIIIIIRGQVSSKDITYTHAQRTAMYRYSNTYTVMLLGLVAD